MIDLFWLDEPSTTANMRFVIAAAAQGMAILTLNYALRAQAIYDGHRTAILGWAIEAQAIAIHQGYYWIWWTLTASHPALLSAWAEYRGIVNAANVMMLFGWVLVASPYFRIISGKWWLGTALSAIGLLYIGGRLAQGVI